MKIKALVPFSNGTLSMEQYEVREVTDSLGNELISAGVAVEIGGGSGGGVLVVTDTDGTLDKTWQEIHDAMLVGSVAIDSSTPFATNIVCVGRVYSTTLMGGKYSVHPVDAEVNYDTDSASGYPTLSE